METSDAIRARRNVRQYKPDPVSEDDLNRIAEAGWRAPSAKNRQAWDFVIVTDRISCRNCPPSGEAPGISPVRRQRLRSFCQSRRMSAET